MNDLLNLERYSEGWLFQTINDNLGHAWLGGKNRNVIN